MMLEVRNLSLKTILKNVSFEASGGEFVWLLGRNGAGKSSLLKCLAGVTSSFKGSVVIDQQVSTNRNFSSLIGYVPQQGDFSSALSVSEALSICSDQFSTNSHHAAHILEKVGLERSQSQLIEELSGGERQKLLLALALVHDPKILLLDEPLAHLDLKAEEEILEILRSIKDKIIIMVSHDYVRAAQEASKILFMHQGELTLLTPPLTAEKLKLLLLRDVPPLHVAYG